MRAMQPDRPSATAEMVASWRALDALLPPERRIVHDPYARAFLGPTRGRLVDAAARLPARALAALTRRLDRLVAGSMSFVLARHRALDELVALEAGRGLEQVVVLGAGYDSRSVRLAGLLEGTRLFEVDHPATAARKAALAPQVFADAPRAETVSVTVDFQRQSLEERLLACGFEPARRTAWLWEGVTMYLTEDAVRGTLAIVRRLSGSGSTLGFDTWSPPGSGLPKLVLRDVPALAMALLYAEPFVWSPAPERVRELLGEEGFALREQTARRPLLARYGGKPAWRLADLTHLYLWVAEVAAAS